MLFPFVGLIFVCVALLPFAMIYLSLKPPAHPLPSFTRFYLGSLLWPLLIAGLLELLQVNDIWLHENFGLAVLLAPGAGALLDTLWRRWSRSSAEPRDIISALCLTGLMVAVACFHFWFVSNIESNPIVDDQALLGTWRGHDGELVLSEQGDWRRSGDFIVLIRGSRYRLVESFGRLCLATGEDPDEERIVYRKLPES